MYKYSYVFTYKNRLAFALQTQENAPQENMKIFSYERIIIFHKRKK